MRHVPAARDAATTLRPRPSWISWRPPGAWRCRRGAASRRRAPTAMASRATSPKVCPTCNGSGVISRNQGRVRLLKPCTDTGGNRSSSTPCEYKGTGDPHRAINVRIPPGVEDERASASRSGRAEICAARAPSRGSLRDGAWPDKIFGRGDDLNHRSGPASPGGFGLDAVGSCLPWAARSGPARHR